MNLNSNMRGIITTVQRMSIHDGPGIRSTVFLKGCNFRCKWCHNPETWSSDLQLQRIKERCISCGTCVPVCPQAALVQDSKNIVLDIEKCSVCGKCVDVCVSGAFSIVGRWVEVNELVRELLRDKPYYDESGGGITLSGGEPLLQLSFVREVLEHSKQLGVHTAVESNLSVSQQKIKEVLPLVDLWMVDLKIADETVHREWTGASNRQTIDNLRFLCHSGVEPIVRTPIIPGVNDSPDAIEMICEILKELAIKRYELMPFHPLGFDKFKHLGIVNPLAGKEGLKVTSLDKLNEVVNSYSLNKKEI